MQKLILVIFSLVIVSCQAPQGKRDVARVDNLVRMKLTGTYLGLEDRTRVLQINKKLMRIYLEPVPDEIDSYYVVLLKYYDLLGIFPKYLLSNKSQKISNYVGYLKKITKSIAAYKMVPIAGDAKKYELLNLKVSGDQIETFKSVNGQYLHLGEGDESAPLADAKITGLGPDIHFPKNTKVEQYFKGGLNLTIANTIYGGLVDLKSTWRDKFLPGHYLAAYGKVDDVVLSLLDENNSSLAQFRESYVGSQYAQRYSVKKRREVFTSPKSYGLDGIFEVTQPARGMFLFNAERQTPTAEVVEGRIGLFIDIFDATEALGQDVVELALINPDNPEDFLMYYEHPENGEGGAK